MDKAEQIHQRYLKGYVTDEQLYRYYELGVITLEQYNTWIEEKRNIDL